MSKVASFRGIHIVVRTRDEHCEPHVHAYHFGQGWEMRVFFSYVSDRIVDLELLHGRAPSQSVVQAIMDKVIDLLDKARTLFWEAVQTTCLDNQYIAVVKGVAHSALKETAGAILIKTARYIPDSKSIEYTAAGSTTSLLAKCP